jgi:hypothetical protein
VKLVDNGFKKLDLKGVVRPYIYFAFIYNYINFALFVKAIMKEFKKILIAMFNNLKGLIQY